MRVAAWLVAAAVARASSAQAVVCEISGAEAPDVTTILASARSTDSEAVVLQPDCSYMPLTPDRGHGYSVYQSSPQRIASIPRATSRFHVSGPLSRGADFTAAPFLEEVLITEASSSASAKTFAFPSSVATLTFTRTGIADFEFLSVPNGVQALTIRENKQLKSLTNIKLPSSLYSLDLSNNQLKSIDFALPRSLSSLDASSNPISTLQGVVLPGSLQKLTLGVLTTFEIRESDVPVLNQLSLSAAINQPKCSDKTAKVVVVTQGNVCVISDARFNELYAGGPPTSPSDTTDAAESHASTSSPGIADTNLSNDTQNLTDPSNTSSDPTGTSSRIGGSVTISGGNGTLTGEGASTSTEENGGVSAEEVAGSGTTSKKGARTSSPDSGASSGEVTTNGATSSSAHTLIIVLLVAGSALVALVGVVVYRIIIGSQVRVGKESTMMASGEYNTVDSPQTATHSSSESHELRATSSEYLENDVRNDKAVSLYRIDSSAVQLGEIIARGGFGVIYRGVFGGRSVAVKQMLPDTFRNEARVKSFMDEIRLCVRLDHPKIVHCVGINWTSLRDLSVVIEFMDGGDLHSLLHSQSDQSTGAEWVEPWTDFNIKSKTSIATDVAEAIVYLHSFSSPIIHRDLKAKNVLLDTKGNAKLSDFGISREVSMDETMTREIGTVAWIAPEVLRGERYSEKADIYSLGVLLIELDRCRHPYSQEDLLNVDEANSRGRSRTKGGTVSQAAMKNTRIAIMVSTGKLRPKPSLACPSGVKLLVDRCLTFDAAKRPNAMEVHHALRLIRKSTSSIGPQ